MPAYHEAYDIAKATGFLRHRITGIEYPTSLFRVMALAAVGKPDRKAAISEMASILEEHEKQAKP